MTRCFFCGKFTCLINAGEEIIGLIPDRWGEYEQAQISSSRTVQISLTEGMTNNQTEESDGWFVRVNNGFSMAVYCKDGKALFGLQTREPDSVLLYIRKALDSYIRIGIHFGFIAALYQECIGLHGVTVLCGNEIIVLSAPSGTGKTTLSELLEEFCDAVVINGDFALLSLINDSVFFEPTPFCGTSNRALNHRFRVNRVVFLGQAKENHWYRLDGREAMARFMSNAFVPEWDIGKTQAVQGNIMKCINTVQVNAFDFAPTEKAAKIFFENIVH